MLLCLQTLSAEQAPKTELTHEEAIEEIMDLSGLNDQVPQIADSVIMTFMQEQNKFPEEIRADVMKTITLAFNGDSMRQTVKNEVAQKVSLEESKSLLKWYRSILGMQISNLEKTPPEPEDYQVMLEQAKTLTADKERLALCQKIDKAAHLTEYSLNIQMGIMRSTLKLMQPNADETRLDNYLKETRQNMQKQMEQIQILSLLYTYRELDSEALSKYADFLSKDTSQAFLNSANVGIQKAILSSTDNMLNELVKLRSIQQ